MTSLFISYSRKDIEFARRLTEAFKDQGLDFWIDWEGIPPTANWWKEIEKGIEEADIFLFLISPDSVNSKVCGQEIDYAVKNGKRLIPLVVRDIKAEEAPAALGSLNWIFLRTVDDFDVSFSKLITAIKTDYAWTQTHRQLQVKALEWERSNRENSFLLRGKELGDAEFQLAVNTSRQPHPTDLQREYIFSSRKLVDRQRRIFTITIVIVAIALLGLGIFSVIKAVDATKQAATAQAASTLAMDNAKTAEANANLAEDRTRIARGGELAALAQNKSHEDLSLALLLAIEAQRQNNQYRTRAAMLDALGVVPQLRYFAYGNSNAPLIKEVNGLTFSPDGKVLAVGGCESSDVAEIFCSTQRVTLRNADNGLPIGEPLVQVFQELYSPEDISFLQFGINGRYLVSQANDYTLDVYNSVTHQVTSALNPFYRTDTAVSPDAKWLAYISCAFDITPSDCYTPGIHESISFLNLETGQPLDRHLPLANLVSQLRYGSDGNTLMTVGCVGWEDGSGCRSDLFAIDWWDLRTGKMLDQSYQVPARKINVGPNGKSLVALDVNDLVTLWDTSTGQPIHQPIAGKFIGFNADGSLFATASGDGNILLWDAQTSLQRARIQGEPPLAFSQDGRKLAFVQDGESVVLWDLEQNQLIESSFAGNKASHITRLVFSQDGNRLAIGDSNGTIAMLDLTIEHPIETMVAQSEKRITLLVQDRKSQGLLSLNASGTVQRWDLPSHKSTGKSFQVSDTVLDIDQDHKTIITAKCDQEDSGAYNCLRSHLNIWDLFTGNPIEGDHPLQGYIAAISPKRNLVATVGCGQMPDENGVFCKQGTITLWNVETSQPIGQPLASDIMFNTVLTFSPNGKVLATAGCDRLFIDNGLGCEQNQLVLWDVDSHQAIEKVSLDLTTDVSNLVFDEQGQILAITTEHGILLWDVINGRLLGQPLPGPDGAITFSPDGSTLAAGGCGIWDKSSNCVQGGIQLWDIASRQPIGEPLLGHQDSIAALIFAPDGKTLWSGGDDGQIMKWNLDVQSWISLACETAGRNFTQSEWSQYFLGDKYQSTCSQWPAGH